MGEVVVLRTKDDANGVEGAIKPRRHDDARWCRRSRSLDCKTVTGSNRAALHAAEAGARMGGVRSQHLWQNEAPRHRQIAPRAAGPGADFQRGALVQTERHRWRQWPAVEADRKFAAGDGHLKRRGLRGHFDTAHGNLDRRRTCRVADGEICRRMRQPIHRTRGGDAKPQIAVPSRILQRRARSGR